MWNSHRFSLCLPFTIQSLRSTLSLFCFFVVFGLKCCKCFLKSLCHLNFTISEKKVMKCVTVKVISNVRKWFNCSLNDKLMTPWVSIKELMVEKDSRRFLSGMTNCLFWIIPWFLFQPFALSLWKKVDYQQWHVFPRSALK